MITLNNHADESVTVAINQWGTGGGTGYYEVQKSETWDRGNVNYFAMIIIDSGTISGNYYVKEDSQVYITNNEVKVDTVVQNSIILPSAPTGHTDHISVSNQLNEYVDVAINHWSDGGNTEFYPVDGQHESEWARGSSKMFIMGVIFPSNRKLIKYYGVLSGYHISISKDEKVMYNEQELKSFVERKIPS